MTLPDLASILRFRPTGLCLRPGLVAWAVFFLILAAGGNALAWGPGAHRMVNNWAVQTLPPEMRGFFAANRQYLTDHANDPVEWMEKDRYERKQHYIYLDKYGRFPFLDLPHSFKSAIERYGSGRVNRNGLLPWHIGEFSLRLTNALKAHDWEQAKEVAAALAHYVADAHDPLHTTENYDGQLTGQPGLEQRFGFQVVDRYQSFFIIRPDPAVKIEDPTEYAFGAVLESHTWVDQIILDDRLAVRDLMGYNDDYFDRFYSRTGSLLIRQINLAVHDAGSYWYTAWLNAGRPPLPGH